MDLDAITEGVRSGDYYFTGHAIQQMAQRTILRREVEEPILGGELIEEYPGHHYGPCCLVYGLTGEGRHLHVVVSVRPIWIITAYDPDPEEWIGHKVRR